LNNEGMEVANGLPKPNEGSLNRTNGLYFYFKMRTGCTLHPVHNFEKL